MRWNALRMLTAADRPELSGASYDLASCTGRRLHRDLGELAMDVLGADDLREVHADDDRPTS